VDAGTAEYLSSVTSRLEGDGFRLQFDFAWRTYELRCVAFKRRWAIEYLGSAGISFLFADLQGLDMNALRRFSMACFAYAKRLRRIPLPYGFGEMVVCIPVALVGGVDISLAHSVRDGNPLKHWGNFLIPVVVDVAAGELYYSQTSPMRGKIYLDLFKQMLREALAP
jgi:hypothetical protein